MKLIDRPEYLEKLKMWLEHADVIKIVTGVRRCGKSILLTLLQRHLLSNGVEKSQIQEFQFELSENEEFLDRKKLHAHVLENLNPDKMNYVFLDEIQLVNDWQKTVNSLRMRPNIDLYLTGSNAYMFSGELATIIGGRYVEIKMLPLSFKEYVMGTGGASNLQEKYDKYIRESGFPQTVAFSGNRQLINDYLMNTVYQNTIQKDIVKRFKIKDPVRLENVVRYMFDNIGNETSLRGIERGLKADGISISPTTIDIYIQGLLDSYLMYKCDRYDIKGKKILQLNSKYYVADIGLRAALFGRTDRDFGYVLENIVYLELLRRGYRVSVGKIKEIEVDFVATKPGGEVEYYQVALTVLDPSTLRRELASLEEIEDNYPKYLLTMDYGTGSNNGIKRINILDWLI
ncbi:MAG: ATP-binding protein [Fibromonadaceae bacterium]|jgi:predicted AAA+ superfamily ATPase|nr:ATP-binding protein [Fibromonadaceae bacterium]